MNKKPIVPRILLLSLLYMLVFVVIVKVQFSGQREAPAETELGPAEAVFDPRAFTVPQALTGRDFNAAVSRWRGENFLLWNRLVPEQNDEVLVAAFVGEALSRSAYGTAKTAIPRAFLNGNRRTHVSAVYLGQLDAAYQSLAASDREQQSRILRLIQEKSPDLLKENDAFEFLAERGYNRYIEEGGAFISTLAPENLLPELIPGVFAGYCDWKHFRAEGENPFDRLVDSAAAFVSESVWMNAGKTQVFALKDGKIDTEFNVRLGKALLDWAELEKNDSWAALARTIILSVFSLEENGAVRGEFTCSAEGEVSTAGGVAENPEAPLLSAARIYRLLGYGEFNPRALLLSLPSETTWAWTAAQTVSASEGNNVVDIAVSFPAGETHYMIVSGIRPFAKIQLYGMDFRTDPQFERYDSSGWAYVEAEQILLVKMKHRSQDEHIRIFY